MMRHHHRSRLLAIVVAAGLVAAACGGDDDAAPATTAAPTTAAPAEPDDAEPDDVEPDDAEPDTPDDPEPDTTDDGSEPGADVDPAARERVEAFRQPVTELPLSEPVAAESGKTVFYVQCSVPVCAEIAIGVEAAAEAIGWEYQTASHQDTPDTVASAFDAAIAAQPDVVLTSGNPREWFASQLETLESQGIPVVGWSLPETYEPGGGISVNLLTQDDYYFYGVLMADYAAVHSANSEILFVGLPTFPVLSIVQQGFEDEIAQVCPDCDVRIIEVAVTDLGTNLPGLIISELQTNPDLDMIAYAFGGMLFGVPEAITGAGLDEQAVAVSQAGGPLNFGFIVNGDHQVAEVGIASELMGWRAIDASARILAGEGAGRAETPAAATIDGRPDILSGGLPLQILEAGAIDDPNALWPGVPGFQDQFTALWAG